ncbi:MAG: hypothetical protein NTV89_09490 [Proteobacteria bacterium]|nr:hypothetical protein [Pseudomonadota bacterium]
MRRLITTSIAGAFIAIVLCLAFTAPAAAKISAQITASDAGLYVNYDLWIIGKKQTTLTPASQPLVISVLGLATIELTVLDIQADAKIVKINAKASAPLAIMASITACLSAGSFLLKAARLRFRHCSPASRHNMM